MVLVSIASAQIFADNKLSPFTNVLPEQLDVKGRLQFQKYPTHQCTKMSRSDSLCFWTRNFQNCQKFFISNLVITLPLRILLKP